MICYFGLSCGQTWMILYSGKAGESIIAFQLSIVLSIQPHMRWKIPVRHAETIVWCALVIIWTVYIWVHTRKSLHPSYFIKSRDSIKANWQLIQFCCRQKLTLLHNTVQRKRKSNFFVSSLLASLLTSLVGGTRCKEKTQVRKTWMQLRKLGCTNGERSHDNRSNNGGDFCVF